jgi:hypothetical protein
LICVRRDCFVPRNDALVTLAMTRGLTYDIFSFF